jgi:hypothetical protein
MVSGCTTECRCHPGRFREWACVWGQPGIAEGHRLRDAEGVDSVRKPGASPQGAAPGPGAVLWRESPVRAVSEDRNRPKRCSTCVRGIPQACQPWFPEAPRNVCATLGDFGNGRAFGWEPGIAEGRRRRRLSSKAWGKPAGRRPRKTRGSMEEEPCKGGLRGPEPTETMLDVRARHPAGVPTMVSGSTAERLCHPGRFREWAWIWRGNRVSRRDAEGVDSVGKPGASPQGAAPGRRAILWRKSPVRAVSEDWNRANRCSTCVRGIPQRCQKTPGGRSAAETSGDRKL